jgi:uncharacterized protein (TIGR02001 family)
VPRVGLRAAFCASLFSAGCAAFAQTGSSITLVSDYRYRGVSLSDSQPTLRLGIVHDEPSGWYGGASLARVSLDPPRHQLQLLGYAGYASRPSDRLGWEAGGLAVHFGADSRFDYQELFTGVQGDRWSLRIHFAPSYFGSGAHTVYGELNSGLPLSRSVRAVAHAGALMRVGGAPADAQRLSLDVSLGLAIARDAWDVSLDWVAGSRSGVYPVAYGRAGGVLVLSASLAN